MLRTSNTHINEMAAGYFERSGTHDRNYNDHGKNGRAINSTEY